MQQCCKDLCGLPLRAELVRLGASPSRSSGDSIWVCGEWIMASGMLDNGVQRLDAGLCRVAYEVRGIESGVWRVDYSFWRVDPGVRGL